MEFSVPGYKYGFAEERVIDRDAAASFADVLDRVKHGGAYVPRLKALFFAEIALKGDCFCVGVAEVPPSACEPVAFGTFIGLYIFGH
jgi:hypothetical protein